MAIIWPKSFAGSPKTKAKLLLKIRFPASLAFHKVLSSFHQNYQDTIKRELTAGDISLAFGPYAIDDIPQMPALDALLGCARELRCEDSPKAGLRRWLSELYHSKGLAEQLVERIIQIAKEKEHFRLAEFDRNMAALGQGLSLAHPLAAAAKKTPIFDILTVLSLGE